ncbi:hypothetical protein HDU97_004591 [Phlyctochytrium planicorne]|nr:hypothetical protein HDU97_004591 [Phlyctochytrium planicorne]
MESAAPVRRPSPSKENSKHALLAGDTVTGTSTPADALGDLTQGRRPSLMTSLRGLRGATSIHADLELDDMSVDDMNIGGLTELDLSGWPDEFDDFNKPNASPAKNGNASPTKEKVKDVVDKEKDKGTSRQDQREGSRESDMEPDDDDGKMDVDQDTAEMEEKENKDGQAQLSKSSSVSNITSSTSEVTPRSAKGKALEPQEGDSAESTPRRSSRKVIKRNSTAGLDEEVDSGRMQTRSRRQAAEPIENQPRTRTRRKRSPAPEESSSLAGSPHQKDLDTSENSTPKTTPKTTPEDKLPVQLEDRASPSKRMRIDHENDLSGDVATRVSSERASEARKSSKKAGKPEHDDEEEDDDDDEDSDSDESAALDAENESRPTSPRHSSMQPDSPMDMGAAENDEDVDVSLDETGKTVSTDATQKDLAVDAQSTDASTDRPKALITKPITRSALLKDAALAASVAAAATSTTAVSTRRRGPGTRKEKPETGLSAAVTKSAHYRPYNPAKMAAMIPPLMVDSPQEFRMSLMMATKSDSIAGQRGHSLPRLFLNPPEPFKKAFGDYLGSLPITEHSIGPLPSEIMEAALHSDAEWLPAELEGLNRGLEACGRNFSIISRDYVPTRTTAECIASYYQRKHSLRFTKVKAYKKQVEREEDEYIQYVNGVAKFIASEAKRLKAERNKGGPFSLANPFAIHETPVFGGGIFTTQPTTKSSRPSLLPPKLQNGTEHDPDQDILDKIQTHKRNVSKGMVAAEAILSPFGKEVGPSSEAAAPARALRTRALLPKN